MLIAPNQALSQIERYLEQHPDDDEVPDQEELRRMVRPAARLLLGERCAASVRRPAYGEAEFELIRATAHRRHSAFIRVTPRPSRLPLH
jgi:hypothetical protein